MIYESAKSVDSDLLPLLVALLLPVATPQGQMEPGKIRFDLSLLHIAGACSGRMACLRRCRCHCRHQAQQIRRSWIFHIQLPHRLWIWIRERESKKMGVEEQSPSPWSSPLAAATAVRRWKERHRRRLQLHRLHSGSPSGDSSIAAA
jgi:hypothetical protein